MVSLRSLSSSPPRPSSRGRVVIGADSSESAQRAVTLLGPWQTMPNTLTPVSFGVLGDVEIWTCVGPPAFISVKKSIPLVAVRSAAGAVPWLSVKDIVVVALDGYQDLRGSCDLVLPENLRTYVDARLHGAPVDDLLERGSSDEMTVVASETAVQEEEEDDDSRWLRDLQKRAMDQKDDVRTPTKAVDNDVAAADSGQVRSFFEGLLSGKTTTPGGPSSSVAASSSSKHK